MLQKLRDIANLKIVQLALALFLAVPFALFGVDYYFRSDVGSDSVANVGRQRIGQRDFEEALRRQAELYRQQFHGQFDASIMDNPQIRLAVLDRLVNDRLVSIGADRAGVAISDRLLAQRIAGEPVFQVDGKFSQQRYDDVARSMNLSPIGLDERLRQDYRDQQFRSSITDTAIVPRSTIEAFIKLSEQTRDVSVVNLSPEAYTAKVKVTPEQVKAYYDAHHPEFTTPEEAKVEYVELSLDTLAAQTTVSPDEVKQAYDEQLKQGKWGQPEQRRVSHILVALKPNATDAEKKAALEKAQKIAAEVRRNPSSFAQVAKKESQDPGSAANGGDLGFFGRGAMVKSFEDAAFAAKKGEIVGPVQSDFGYHIIRVDEIRPSKVKSLAEATPEIEATLKKQKATTKFADAAEQFSNIVYEQPNSLKPASDALKLPLQQSNGWVQKGGAANPPLLANPKLQAELFSDNSIKAKRNTSAIEVAPSDYVAAHVVDYKPATLQPLDSVKAGIEQRLARDEALKLAAADGEAKLKELKAGKDPGLKWPAPLAVNRQKPGGLPPQVIEGVFHIDPRKVPAYVGVSTPQGYSLVRVSKVNEPTKIDEAQRTALANRLRETVGVEELDATLGSLRERVGVTYRKQAIEKQPQS